MPLGMEIGLSPGHIVLDRGPSFPPSKKGHSHLSSKVLFFNKWRKKSDQLTQVSAAENDEG